MSHVDGPGPAASRGPHDHAPPHDPVWQQDNVVLRSVGMDIGSSGTQVLFSWLHLRRIGEELSSRYVVVDRHTTYRSPVALTPYSGGETIDAVALGSIIDEAYAAARTTPDDVDTGVVILTGETLRRDNAEAIARTLADRGGDLVTASAGHHMEALLAAYGSGAAQVSHDRGCRLLAVDVGGGTTKLAILDRGRVVATAAVHIGGRHLVHDGAGRAVRLEPAGVRHARDAGVVWALGAPVTSEEIETVASHLAERLLAVIRSAASGAVGNHLPDGTTGLHLTDPLPLLGDVDGVMFSGGVAEYVYDREPRGFADLGAPLGHALRRRIEDGALPFGLLPPGECIRATALGAAEFSVALSGNTGWTRHAEALLPRRNLKVVRPEYTLDGREDGAIAELVSDAIRRHLVAMDADGTDEDVALALRWRGPPSHRRLHAFAVGVRDGLARRVEAGSPLYVILDGDVAMTLGRLLRDELGVTNELLVVDGLSLRDFDYVDIGRVRHPSRTVPVSVKSLLFTDDPRDAPDGVVRTGGTE